jgi:hypothetical protein
MLYKLNKRFVRICWIREKRPNLVKKCLRIKSMEQIFWTLYVDLFCESGFVVCESGFALHGYKLTGYESRFANQIHGFATQIHVFTNLLYNSRNLNWNTFSLHFKNFQLIIPSHFFEINDYIKIQNYANLNM